MKKVFTLLLMCLILVSCSNTNNGSPVEVTLDTPILSFDSETGLVNWNEVKDATYYNYIINDGDVLSTTSLSLQLNDKQTISVQAVNNESVSDWSYAVTNYDTNSIYEEIDHDVYVKFHNANVQAKKINAGEKVERPVAPLKEYYTFDNWYKDPYYQEVFDFNEPIYSSTIIYANYIPNDLIKDTYFWVKGNPKMYSSVMSSGTASDWHFIPLKSNESNTNYKEFIATVTVTNASTIDPCYFIVMDGFSNDQGRTYWKNNGNDFAITEDGIYNIYFSVEHQYSKDINVSFKKVNNTDATILYKNNNMTLTTPNVSIDNVNNLAKWNKVNKATKYEVIIDNGEVIKTQETSIELNKGSFITVRALNDTKYSSWSIPKANIKRTLVENVNNNPSVYFVGYDAYNVELNTSIQSPAEPTKEGFTFGGWYLDIACTQIANFPYEITENTVFYPKWISNDDYKNKVYYKLTLSDGTFVSNLTWNLDNYNFDEYQTETVKLNADTEYYIVSTSDPNIKYGPYKVDKEGGYTVYFSEDYFWDSGNVYFASSTRTFYFSCPTGWTDTVYAYVWSSVTGDIFEYWPGYTMQYVETNGYGEKIYKIDIDLTLYDYIIFTHGSNGTATGSQSVDICLTKTSDNGFYLTEKNSSGKYQYGTYSR